MPLSIAMALSGISRDQWGHFAELFDQGAQVVNQEAPGRPISRGSDSAHSSRSASPASSSRESGIGSSSPDSVASTSSSDIIPVTLRDFCLFKVAAMKGDGPEIEEIIQKFDTAQEEPEQNKNEEPGEKNKPVIPQDRERINAEMDLNLHVDTERNHVKANEKSDMESPTLQINWTGRNLLDLAANMKGNDRMCTAARLPQNVTGYFQNRSQISRVKGAFTPPHELSVCSDLACEFEEPLF